MEMPIRLAPKASVSTCRPPKAHQVSGSANSTPVATGTSSNGSRRGVRNTAHSNSSTPISEPSPMVDISCLACCAPLLAWKTSPERSSWTPG